MINVRPIGSVHHVFACNKVLGPIVIVPIDAIISKVVFMSFSDTDDVYVAKFPNCIDKNCSNNHSNRILIDMYTLASSLMILNSTSTGYAALDHALYGLSLRFVPAV